MRTLHPLRRLAAWSIGLAFVAAPALAWDAHGHRVITALALDGVALDPALPKWLQDPGVRKRIEFQCAEPDRWRGQPNPVLKHENNPDHYIDVEKIEPFGLSLATIPPLRNEYLRVMAVAKSQHPERFADYDPAKDAAREQEWPGFIAHAIVEHYAKLQASFRTLRILEALDDSSRAPQVEQERANVIYHMGALSHFVGDASQPLHTTRHHHGWVGDNPSAYTTDRGFHAYIDGRILQIHAITHDSLRPLMKFDRSLGAGDPWPLVLEELARSYQQVEPLYRMQKDATLEQEPGKKLINERLVDAAETLNMLYRAAWATSEPDGREIELFRGWTPTPDAQAARPADGDKPAPAPAAPGAGAAAPK